MITNRKKALIAGLLVIPLIIIFRKFDPESTVFFPKCVFKLLTGLDCPGCGLQRMVYYMLNLEFGNAIRANALLFFAIPYILPGLVIGLFKYNNNIILNNIYNKLYGIKALLVTVVIVIFWFIYRNFSVFP